MSKFISPDHSWRSMLSAAVGLILTAAILLPTGQLATNSPHLVAQWFGDKVWNAAYSLEGRYLLTGDETNVATLWGLETGRIVRRFTGHTSEVNSVAYFPNAKHLATGGDSTIRIWDMDIGRELKWLNATRVPGLKGYAPNVTSIAISSDGRQILMGRWD